MLFSSVLEKNALKKGDSVSIQATAELASSAIMDFTIGEKTVGLFVNDVKELVQPVSVKKVPSSHPFLKGLIRLREDVIPLIDLPKMLQAEKKINSQGEDEKHVIALHNGQTIGLYVHAINDIQTFEAENLIEPEGLSDTERQFTSHVLQRGTDNILVIDIEKLANYIKTLNSLRR